MRKVACCKKPLDHHQCVLAGSLELMEGILQLRVPEALAGLMLAPRSTITLQACYSGLCYRNEVLTWDPYGSGCAFLNQR